MPGKATSKRQFRFLKGIMSGSIPPRKGLSASKADEMLGHQSPRGLPEAADSAEERAEPRMNPAAKAREESAESTPTASSAASRVVARMHSRFAKATNSRGSRH